MSKVTLALIALAVLAVIELARWLWRRRVAATGGTAYGRAAALGRAVAEAHARAQAERPGTDAEELRVLALTRASGKSEAEVAALVDEARGISELHSSLRMLATRLAVQAERGREEDRDQKQMRGAIADAQRAVYDTVPGDL